MSASSFFTSNIRPFAKAGLIAKGIVYCLIGILTFMAAFQLGGRSTGNADRQGALKAIDEQTGGKIILLIVALGLFCYTIWRVIQTFDDTEDKGNDLKGIAQRARYLFSGLVYASFGVVALKVVFASGGSSGDSRQQMASELLSKPFGQWLAGIAAAIIIGTGIYQVYYGLSEKYSKHLDKVGADQHTKLLIGAGKFGFIARGIVWMIIGWLFAKAALSANAKQAGDTSKAFKFLSDAAYGSYLLGAVGFGLLCYGLFNFIRARYEHFG